MWRLTELPDGYTQFNFLGLNFLGLTFCGLISWPIAASRPTRAARRSGLSPCLSTRQIVSQGDKKDDPS